MKYVSSRRDERGAAPPEGTSGGGKRGYPHIFSSLMVSDLACPPLKRVLGRYPPRAPGLIPHEDVSEQSFWLTILPHDVIHFG